MAKAVTKGEAWNMIRRNENLDDLPNASTVFDNKKVTRQVEFATSDSGAMSYPITIKLPDGSLIYF